ncbi:hypothetical protein ACFQPF_13015 [Fictibacillus iocasae]|uniref:Uncharacterized protein n=1 Tax=Fictibacillus iocasae TaxID=2715437 RepID=A0ABW2NQ48_9BACL
MTQITFLASSKPFTIPDEIDAFNRKTVFEKEEDAVYLSIHSVDEYWREKISGLFSMPYIYEAFGIESDLFLVYMEKYMELGDVLEIYQVPNQHDLERCIQSMKEHPEPVEINAARHTYQTVNGQHSLNPKKWIDELRHRNYLTPRGLTTVVKY